MRLSEYLAHETEFLPFAVFELAIEYLEDLYATSDDFTNFNVSTGSIKQ